MSQILEDKISRALTTSKMEVLWTTKPRARREVHAGRQRVLSKLLFIFVHNKLVIVIAGFTLFLLRNAFVTKHYITKFTADGRSE